VHVIIDFMVETFVGSGAAAPGLIWLAISAPDNAHAIAVLRIYSFPRHFAESQNFMPLEEPR
jgi:hypothetical protein